MKKISVLITAYNLQDYIDKSISSVVQQEMPCDWELLIGDDGSTDNTVSIVNQWIEKYPDNIKLYQWMKDEQHSMNGFRAATNRANLLEKASGDYLIFLDGDDWWIGTDKLKTQFELLESEDNQDCSCCAHNIFKYVWADESGEDMVDKTIPMRKFTPEEYWRDRYFHTNTILFRKKCKELLLDSLYRKFLNDNFITYILIQYGSILYVNKTWAQYNITGSGLWTGHNFVFGCFRNLHLYDLELRINPKMADLSFRRHGWDFETISKQYGKKNVEEIKPLIEGLDPEIFHYTILFSKISGLTLSERVEKSQIVFKEFLIHSVKKIKKEWKKLSRKSV